MKKILKVFFVLIFLFSSSVAYCQPETYDYLIDLGKTKFENGAYDEALYYFQLAQLLNPSSKDVRYYINLIKRTVEGRVIVSEEQIQDLESDILKKKRVAREQEKEVSGNIFVPGQDEEKVSAVIEEKQKKEEKTEYVPIKKDKSQRIKEIAVKKSLPREEIKKKEIESTAKISGQKERTTASGIISFAEKEKNRTIPKGRAPGEVETGKLEVTKTIALGVKKQTGGQGELFVAQDRGGGEKTKAAVTTVPQKTEEKTKGTIGVQQKERIQPKTKGKKDSLDKIDVIQLSPERKKDFPLTVELTPQKILTVEGKNITRFLIVSPDVVTVERVSASTVHIVAKAIGITFVHVWDSQDRWTFNVKVLSPYSVVKKEARWEQGQGFKFTYNNLWRHYYQGRKLERAELKNLRFLHTGKITGPTPYGDFDSSVSWSREGELEKVTYYTVGLTKAHMFNLRDIKLRGFDFTTSLSPLTFPGMTMRGALVEASAFNRQLEFRIFQGIEKSVYWYLTPGVYDQKKSYVEAVRVGLFPHKDNKFYFNYAHGYGEGREKYLKSDVYSVQTEHKLGDTSLFTEVATDEEKTAATISSVYKIQDLTLRASLRDIDKDFVTITGWPASRGERGGMLGFDWHPSKDMYLNSNVNVHRDRYLYNPIHSSRFNLNWDTGFQYYLSPVSNVSSNLYYIDTQGESFPQRMVSTTTTYNHRFNMNLFGQRMLSTYFGYTFQRSENLYSRGSDYQRNGLLTGLRLPLAKDLSYYVNYRYTWLEELMSNARSCPMVTETGFDYSYRFSESFRTQLRGNYRNEQKASSMHSFLSGQDTLEGSIYLNYMPQEDIDIFFDGTIRQVWAGRPEDNDFIETEFRMGTKITWDNFFRWIPTVKVEGFVFKDVNSNEMKDKNEQGIPNVKVVVGPKELSTDAQGRFSTSLRAKKLVTSIDLNTVPEGMILTTVSSQEIEAGSGGIKPVNFGLSYQSGIYGVIFYDVNGDGKLDRSDIPVSKAKIILDKKKIALTDDKGSYFFPNVPSGMHNLTLDVGSLPFEYLPTVSVKKDLELTEGLTYTYYIPLKKNGHQKKDKK